MNLNLKKYFYLAMFTLSWSASLLAASTTPKAPVPSPVPSPVPTPIVSATPEPTHTTSPTSCLSRKAVVSVQLDIVRMTFRMALENSEQVSKEEFDANMRSQGSDLISLAYDIRAIPPECFFNPTRYEMIANKLEEYSKAVGAPISLKDFREGTYSFLDSRLSDWSTEIKTGYRVNHNKKK